MNRRGFLGSILALGAAPAIVRADSLMRIVPMETEILTGPNVVFEGDSLMLCGRWQYDLLVAQVERARSPYRWIQRPTVIVP